MNTSNVADFCSASNPSFRPIPQSYDGLSGCAVPINSTYIPTLIKCCSGFVDDKVVNFNLTYEPYYSVFPQTEHEGPDCYAVCSVDVNTMLYTDYENITSCFMSIDSRQNASEPGRRYCGGWDSTSAASVNEPGTLSRALIGLLGVGAWVLVSIA